MSIWEHRDAVETDWVDWPRPNEWEQLQNRACCFCRTPLECLLNREPDYRDQPVGSNDVYVGIEFVAVCQVCGWWTARLIRDWVSWGQSARQEFLRLFAMLHELDLTNVSTPINEVRSFLIARYEARKNIHPRLMEQTVGSVFRDFGYSSEVTCYQKDGGVDVILCRAGKRIGVQVKTSKNAIGVEQIRALSDAMIHQGLTKGIFVTTSRFTSDAIATAADYRRTVTPIELIDSSRFFHALRIAQRPHYKGVSDLDLQRYVKKPDYIA